MSRNRVETEVRKSLLKRGVLALIQQGGSLEVILDRLIDNIEAQAGKMMAAVFFYDPTSEDLSVGAAPNLQPVYKKAVNGFKIGPQQPACGSAVFRRERVLSHDVKEDPLWKDLLSYAEAARIRAVWSQPIFDSEGNVLGTLAFYFPEPKSPDISDLVVLEAAADLAALAIQARRDQFAQAHRARKISAGAMPIPHELI